MAVPRRQVDWSERVVVGVETSAGCGEFAVDERLRAESLEVLSDGCVGSARVAVRTDSLSPFDAMTKYHTDRRMTIRAGEVVLFDGYPSRSRLEWPPRTRQRARGARTEVVLVLEHVAGRMARDVRSQIVGRHVRDAAIQDALEANPAAWSGRSALATGLPCIFNLDDVGNCDPEPIQVDDGHGGTRAIHIFSDDARADAVSWTHARALRYLLHFYAWPGCPVGTTQALEQTDAMAALSHESLAGYRGSDELAFALLGRCETLVLEATSFLEALTLLSVASGLHLTAASEPAGRGVRTAWRVWSELSGARRELYLATADRDASGLPLYDPSSKSAVDLFADNNVSSAMISLDARSIGGTALVFGGVRRYEVTVELVPGWLPEAGLDNVVPSGRSSVKTSALTEEQCASMGASVFDNAWYQAYHRNGAAFSEHWRVGRFWTLNEAGDYASHEYARNVPFDTYEPFDFSAVLPGSWMRRRRRFMPAAGTGGQLDGIRVEVSFDGGESWSRIDSGFTVSEDECGIWFDVPNLLSISPAGGETEANLWYALVDQLCRVRVTAVIESDQRIAATAHAHSAPTLHRNGAMLYAPDRFAFFGVQGGAAHASVGEGNARDDSARAQAAADLMAANGGARAVSGRAVIPWLDTDYAIGDQVVSVRGRGVNLTAERAPSRRHPCILGKRYHLDGGRFETELILASRSDEASSEGIGG
ncbi:MAG: hypothetical protein ABII12_14355 [Planctomycetota bacterium]